MMSEFQFHFGVLVFSSNQITSNAAISKIQKTKKKKKKKLKTIFGTTSWEYFEATK